VNIGIDLRALAGSQTSGVKVYLRSILEELFEWDKKNTYLLWWNSASEPCPLEIPRSPRFKLIHTRYSNRYLNLRLRLQNQPFLDEMLLREAQREKQKLDIFWLPDLRPVAVSNHCKLVITLHDLASTLHPEFFSLKTRAWFQFLNPEKITEKADRLIAVSDSTAQDLQRIWKIEAGSISTTPLGVSTRIKPVRSKESLKKVKRKYHLPENFVLSLSTLEPRKNLPTLIRAFAKLKEETNFPHELVLAGNFDQKIFADPKLKKFRNVAWLHFPGEIAENNKAALISAAEIFCFPSVYEGFGLPALEALACGTPLLASDIPALREVCGEAAQFLPPHNSDAWKVALVKLISDKKTAQLLQIKGLIQARKFSWQNTAKATLAAFAAVKIGG
jgi:glycosyltransferase involved in cell wall biosynthesis